jgi:hypothetical protein
MAISRIEPLHTEIEAIWPHLGGIEMEENRDPLRVFKFDGSAFAFAHK